MSTWFRSNQHSVIFVRITMEDLRSKILDAPWAKFFQFHAVLGEIWQNCMLAAPEGWCHHLGEILDPLLNNIQQ